jgi:hypothetical protein
MPGMTVAQKLRRDSKHGQGQGELDVPYRSTNGTGAVLHHLDFDARGNIPDQPRQQQPYLIHSVDDVGARLLIHDEQNAAFAVLATTGRPHCKKRSGDIRLKVFGR